MKKRVLSLTMAFLLAFTMLPTQAAAEELPEYEEVVEENASEEDPLEKDVLETESLEAEAPAAEVENTERSQECFMVILQLMQLKNFVPAKYFLVFWAYPFTMESRTRQLRKFLLCRRY